MKLKLLNISADSVTIGDIGIILNAGESTYIDFIPEINILDSSNLYTTMTTGLISAYIDEVEFNYTDFIASFNRLTEANHEALDTLTHNLSKTNHMTTTKDVTGRTKYITYWTDSSMILKEREDEIIRDSFGKSSEIISKQYNSSGSVMYTETQYLNRSIAGSVDSVTLVKS